VTKRIMPGLVDNFFKNGPIMAYCKRNRMKPWVGGPQIQENYLYKPMKGGFYKKGAQFDITKRQTKTGLLFEPAFAEVNVTEYTEDVEVIVRGPDAVFSLVNVDLGNAAMTLSAILEIAIYKHGQALAGDDRSGYINGLAEALSDGLNASWDGNTYLSYGGQVRADVRPALDSPTGLIAANVNGAITYHVLEHSYMSCVIGPEYPKLGVTTNRCMGFINENFQPQQRLQMGDTVEPTIGWPGIRFKQATIVVSQYAPGADGVNDPDLGNYNAAAETFAWLNPGGEGEDSFFRLHTSTSPKYSFGFTGFKVAQDSTVVAGQILWSGAFTVRTPRLMRILHGITK
jgi:hypothetical protein